MAMMAWLRYETNKILVRIRAQKSPGGAHRWRVTSTTPRVSLRGRSPCRCGRKRSENPPPPLVAVSYRAIEASVMGEGEGSGGGIGGAGGSPPRVSGFEGAEPLASPNV